jgi:hypothetical protein
MKLPSLLALTRPTLGGSRAGALVFLGLLAGATSCAFAAAGSRSTLPATLHGSVSYRLDGDLEGGSEVHLEVAATDLVFTRMDGYSDERHVFYGGAGTFSIGGKGGYAEECTYSGSKATPWHGVSVILDRETGTCEAGIGLNLHSRCEYDFDGVVHVDEIDFAWNEFRLPGSWHEQGGTLAVEVGTDDEWTGPHPWGGIRGKWKRVFTLSASGTRVVPPFVIQGTARYEKIPLTPQGLQVQNPLPLPIIGARVQAVDAPSGAVLAESETGQDGGYELRGTSDGTAYVRVIAETDSARVFEVVSGDQYSVRSPTVSLETGSATVDVLALDSNRGSGPFNILDVIRKANALVHGASAGIQLPRIDVRWATNYAGGTYFKPVTNEAYIRGSRSSDSDEFDDAVIAHEYGHFLAHHFSRLEGPGGAHYIGERLDPRLAWSEGWANFFGCSVIRSPLYVDSQASGTFSLDLERNRLPGDTPGIWSEHSVGSTLWDLFDEPPDSGDSITLGFGPVWTAFTGDLRQHRFVYLIDFCEALVGDSGALAKRVGSILKERRLRYVAGASPPVDIPFPTPIASGKLERGGVDSIATARINLYDSAGYFDFPLRSERTVTLRLKTLRSGTPQAANLDLALLDADGQFLAGAATLGGVGSSERIQVRLPAGTYVIVVLSYSADPNNPNGYRLNAGEYSLEATYSSARR